MHAILLIQRLSVPLFVGRMKPSCLVRFCNEVMTSFVLSNLPSSVVLQQPESDDLSHHVRHQQPSEVAYERAFYLRLSYTNHGPFFTPPPEDTPSIS